MLQLLIATHVLPAPVPDKANLPLGLWFVGLAYITISAALASLFEGMGLFAVLSRRLRSGRRSVRSAS